MGIDKAAAKGKSTGKGKVNSLGGMLFAQFPLVVMQCPNFMKLPYSARSLLFEFAMQLDAKTKANNGQLSFTETRMNEREWGSWATVVKAKQELIDGGFLYQTVKGRRPNVASMYALTWHPLAPSAKYDAGAEEGFELHAYMGDWVPPGGTLKLPFKQTGQYMQSCAPKAVVSAPTSVVQEVVMSYEKT